MAEHLIARELESIAPSKYLVSSAGTRALVGHPVEPRIGAALEQRGTSAERFRARQLDEAMLNSSDLVICLSTEHRSEVVTLAPAMLAKTVTLRELGRYFELSRPFDPSHNLAQRWSTVMHDLRRSRRRLENPAENDVIDPYMRDERTLQQCITEITTAVESIISWEAQCQHSATQRDNEGPGAAQYHIAE